MLKGIIAALWDRKERPEAVIPETVFFFSMEACLKFKRE